MSRRMSCALTVDAVVAREKLVTRRHVDSWKALKMGDQLTLIEKGMGLPKGAQQVVLAQVEVVDVRVEVVGRIMDEPNGTRMEGLPEMTGAEFVRFWLESHGYGCPPFSDGAMTLCRRIQWRYL